MFLLKFKDPRHPVSSGKFFRIAGENPRDERVHKPIENFLSESASDKIGEALFRLERPFPNKWLAKETHFSFPRKKWRSKKAGWRHRKRLQFALPNNIAVFRLPISFNDFVGQPKIVDQLERFRGFLKAVGAEIGRASCRARAVGGVGGMMA